MFLRYSDICPPPLPGHLPPPPPQHLPPQRLPPRTYAPLDICPPPTFVPPPPKKKNKQRLRFNNITSIVIKSIYKDVKDKM